MQPSTAYLLIRDLPPYRREAFVTGLQFLGHTVITKPPQFPRSRDILVIWNRYGPNHAIARRFEDVGAAVIVAENGYVDMCDTKKAFALSLHHHNGAGRWPTGASRAHMLVQTVEPWRGDGTRDDILILPQRGVGPPGVAMARGWVADVQRRIAAADVRGRRVRVRPHPGTQKHVRPLIEDLEGVGACVVWGSGAGIKALLYGVPTVHEFPRWIGRAGGSAGLETLRAPMLGDRQIMAEQVAWAQWTVEEVASGEPLRQLLVLHEAKRWII